MADNIPDSPRIPWEYQTSFGEAAEQDRIAQMLMGLQKQQQSALGGQMVSGRFVRPSWTQQLANLYSSYQSGEAMNRAAKMRQDITSRMGQAEGNALQSAMATAMGRPGGNVMGPPDEQGGLGYADAQPGNVNAAVTQAAGSQWPTVQKFGQQLGEQYRAQLKAGAQAATPASAVAAAQSGNLGDLKPNEYGPVDVVARPEGGTPIYGQKETSGKVHFAPQGTNVTMNAARADQGLVADHYKTLMDPKMRDAATRSSDTLTAAASALNLLGSANTGQLADLQTAAQKAAKWLGRDIDPKAPISETFSGLTVSLVGQIITQFGSGTGLSDADREFAKQAVGTLNKDPRAAQALLMETMRRAYKYVTNYNMMAGAGETLAKQAGMNPEIFKSIIMPYRYSAVDSRLGKWTELPPDQWPLADQVLLQSQGTQSAGENPPAQPWDRGRR